MRNTRWIVPMLAIGLCLAGCQSNRDESKAAAVQRWNDVRSSVLASLAQRQFRSGEFDHARKTVDQAMELTPDSAPLHVLSARLSLAKGQLEAAQKDLDEARRLDPDDPQADYYSGIVFQRWQKPKLALSYYASASRKAPSQEEYVLAQAEMMVALNEPNEAISLLQTKMAYFEHSAAMCDALGSLLMRQGDYARAAAVLQQAAIFAPDDQNIREHLALALYFSRQYQKAADVFQPLLADKSRQSRPDLELAMGECLLHLGRPRDALGHLQTAVQLDGRQTTAWIDLAHALVELNRPADARTAVQRALALSPDSAQANLLAGYISLQEKRLDAALPAFQRACRADPDDATGLCMVGYVLQQMGRREEARQWFAAALKASPNDPLAMRMLADAR